MSRYFSNNLQLKNSLINSKVKVGKNHFGERGVFTTKPIRKNEIVFVTFGKILAKRDLDNKSNFLQEHVWQVGNNYFLSTADKSDLDPTDYINHSCDPNVGVVGNNAFVAIENIKAGEELCVDYATSDTLDNNFDCLCGTKLCRGRVRGGDWKRPDLQKRYGQYFSWYILQKIKKQKKK